MKYPDFDIILIDSNNIGYMAYHAMPKEFSADEQKTGLIFGFLSQVNNFINKFNSSNLMFCWDDKKSYRKTIYPEYKSGRNKTSADKIDIYPQFDLLRKKILPEIGFRNVFIQKGIEADDLIAKICNDNLKKNKLIISSDRDLWQLLDYRTFIYSPRTKKLIMKKDFTDEFGPIDPKLFYSQIKAMAGCNTDNVIGIKGIGEKTAARYIYEKQKLSKKKINDIESNRELIERNLKLVKLPYKKTKHQEIRKNEFSKKKTIEIFQQFKFEYFLENFKKWSALWD